MQVNKPENLLKQVIDYLTEIAPVVTGATALRDKLASCTKWINLFNSQYTSNGHSGNWTFVSRKKVPSIEKPDAVVIVPIVKTAEGNKLIIISEFRVPINCFEYGFPAGLIDDQETAEMSAKRELQEETGLNLVRTLYTSKNCISSAGLSDESVVYVICECNGVMSNSGNEATENINIQLLDLEQVRLLLNSKEVISAKALPFLLMFSGLNGINWPDHV